MAQTVGVDRAGWLAGWRRATAGSGWLLSDRLLRLGVGMFVGIVLARLLGPSNYGVFTYATALAILFLPLVSLGLERILVRELARSVESRPGLLGAAFALRLGGGVASALLAVGATLLLARRGSGESWLVALIAAGNVFLAADVIDWAFQADGRFHIPVLARLGPFVLCAVAKIACAAAGEPLAWLAALMLAETALAGITLAFCARRITGAPPSTWTVRRAACAGILGHAWPLFLADLAVLGFQRVDVIILNRFASDAEVGRYAVAARIAQAGFFLPTIAVQVLFPRASRAPDAAAALAMTGRAMRLLSALGFCLALALAVGAPTFIPLLLGVKYAAAAGPMELLAWTNVFACIGSCHALYLVATNQQRLSLGLTWVTAGCSLALNFLLIPRWHALGAAAASLGAYGLTCVFGVTIFRGSRPLFRLTLRALAAPVTLLAEAVRTRRVPMP